MSFVATPSSIEKYTAAHPTGISVSIVTVMVLAVATAATVHLYRNKVEKGAPREELERYGRWATGLACLTALPLVGIFIVSAFRAKIDLRKYVAAC